MRIHFVGIAGSSMSQLAKLMASRGMEVTGSDITTTGHDQRNVVGANLVVYTCAVSQDNVELEYARRANIPLMERAEFLGLVSREYQTVLAVSGAHGKTTTTGMLASITTPLGADIHVGGQFVAPPQGPPGPHNLLVTEACEYQRSFLHLSPTVGIILNIELDHTDYYRDLDDVTWAFVQFADRAKVVVASTQAANMLQTNTKIVTFGNSDSADYCAKNVRMIDGKLLAEISEYGQQLGTLQLDTQGVHNINNALASIAACRLVGIDWSTCVSSLASYAGMRRRFEVFERRNGVIYVSDYAHHPRELVATLNTAKNLAKKVKIIFQPHTFTRTREFQHEFVHALKLADQAVVMPIYAARERPIEGVSAQHLAQLGRFEYMADTDDVVDYMRSAQPGDIVLLVGAGDIDDLRHRL